MKAVKWLMVIALFASQVALAQQPSIEEMERRARSLESQYRELAELTNRGAAAHSLANIGTTAPNANRIPGLEFVATEVTQILNNIQLFLQLLEQIRMVRLQTDQLADMLANSRRAMRYNWKDVNGILSRTEQRLNERLNGWASVFAPNHRMSQENILASFRHLYGHRYDRPSGMSNYDEMAWRRLEGQLEGAMQAISTSRESTDDIADDIALLNRLASDVMGSQGRHQTIQAQAQLDAQQVQQSIRMREQLNQLATLMARQQANDYSREMASRRQYNIWSDPQGRSAAPLNYRGR